jgi:hypothetical protein
MAVLRYLTGRDLDNSIFLEDILLLHHPARRFLFGKHNYGLRRRRCCSDQLVVKVGDHHGILGKRIVLLHGSPFCSCVHGRLIPSEPNAVRGEREIHLLIFISLEIAQKVIL